MKVVTLSGSPRANVGKVNANSLRNSGKVPCVLYGGKEQVHFSAEERDFKNIIYTPEVCFVEIDINGKKTKAVLQEAQYHKINDKLIHADFLEIVANKPVVMNVPVKLKGQSEGVKAGGKLNFKQRMLKIKGLADKLPGQIDLDITSLTVGKSISVGDIKIDGVELLNPKNISVVSVNMSRNVVEEAPAAAPKAAAPAAAPAAAAAAKPAAKK